IKHKKPLNNRIKYKCNGDFFNDINSECKAYWLGFIAADGCVRIDKKGRKYLRIDLSRKDESHLNLFLKDINGTHQLKYYKKYC
ncbi:MAG: hypothetical protein GTO02_10155, partial [Candidatus Dadabacteria bacterium]|nr:hypothetical protein [Candidatus Dadabacteria bacterium]